MDNRVKDGNRLFRSELNRFDLGESVLYKIEIECSPPDAVEIERIISKAGDRIRSRIKNRNKPK